MVVPGASGVGQRQNFGVTRISPVAGSICSWLAANTHTHVPMRPLAWCTEQR
jgi:hypothetical protein